MLLSNKIDKYAHLTGEKILPPQQHRIIEEAKFTYSPIGKAFENKHKISRSWRKTSQNSITFRSYK